ncbi:hypothetical protein BAG01nite_34290 [Brevibacillus agri]|uniref:Uncharacterized protein n=1 Tax=Brevibacillus agri TaxID=51101 RepID=A0ABQ0STU4_9BACL|nr:hypothetical protein BAG01nite_34290 [Brevibacillus agri]
MRFWGYRTWICYRTGGDIMSQPHAEAQPKKPKKLREINVFALLFAVIAVAVVLTYV